MCGKDLPTINDLHGNRYERQSTNNFNDGDVPMRISIYRKNKTPLFLQIKNQIKEMIVNGELIHGFILPSERELAKKLDVHRNTIIRAYQELKADGLINSTKGQYYSVTYEVFYNQGTMRGKKSRIPWEHLTNQDVSHLNDQLFHESTIPKGISFQGVIPSPDVYPKEEIREIFTELINSKEIDIFSYCSSQGSSCSEKQYCQIAERPPDHGHAQ